MGPGIGTGNLVQTAYPGSPPTWGSIQPTAGCSSRMTTGTGSSSSRRADGVYGTADDTTTNFRTAPFGSDDPEGVAYDPATGHLFVSDGAGIEIYRINPVNGVFGEETTSSPTSTSPSTGPATVEGLGINPALEQAPVRGSVDARQHLRARKGGALFRVLSMAALPTSRAVVADVTMAPTSNPLTPREHRTTGSWTGTWTTATTRTKTTASCTRCILEAVPPETTITSGPAVRPTTRHRASASPHRRAARAFECKLDSGAYGACSSPNTTRDLADGSHTF